MTVGDNHQNFVQTYTVTKTVAATGQSTLLNPNTTLMVPPYNTGKRTTPLYDDPTTGRAISGAASNATLDPYTKQTTYTLPAIAGAAGATTVFAGSREDGFYADTPGIFDFLDPRILTPSPAGTFGQTGNGVDGFKGYNVLHYAIVIPLSDLASATSSYTGAFTSGGTNTGVGVYASVSRPRITLRTTTGDNINSGPYIQVNREANPLFNRGAGRHPGQGQL